MNRKFSTMWKHPVAIFLGITFFGSGMAKLYFEHRYFGWIGPVWLEERLSEYNLALYARFIAYSQITIGFLLLTLRYAVLGAVMAVPLILNILMVTISLEWRGTPYVLGVLLLMNCYLLIIDRKPLFALVGYKSSFELPYRTRRGSIIWGGGFFLNLLSINISYVHLPAAWALSAIGLVLCWYSVYADGLRERRQLSLSSAYPEKLP